MPGPRWVRLESARQWKALDPERRAELFAAARRGEHWPDEQEALSAVHWSWAVLGPPHARRGYPLGDLLLHYAPAVMFDNVFDGTREHDTRLRVRREARRVEGANLGWLEELGIETRPSTGSNGQPADRQSN